MFLADYEFLYRFIKRFQIHLGCFPQMKPNKQEQIDGDDKYFEKGVPKYRINPPTTLGFTTLAKLKEVEKPYC